MMKRKRVLLGIVAGNCFGGLYALLLFVRTGIIIKEFGVEINSISQAANQIFNYFILMESGIGAAYLYKMYRPVLEKDFGKLSSYYNALCISMKKVSLKMFFVLILIAVIYPFVMPRKLTTYYHAGLVLFLLGMRFIIPYYMSVASKNLLIANGYKWLIDIFNGLINIVITIVEIILFRCTDLYITSVLLIGILLVVCGNLLYRLVVFHLCPQVTNFSHNPDFSPEVMTKDILFHQFGGLFNNNVDTLILSVADLSEVTTYQAYSSVAAYPINFLNRFSEVFRAKVGIDIAKQDGSVYETFQRLLTLNMCIAVPMIAVYYSCIENIILLWIGEQFILSRRCIACLSIWMFDRIIMCIVYIVRDGSGLYKESKWYSLIQGGLNLILSIILMKPFGIEGLLIATVLANLLWNESLNFRLIYKKVFHRKNDMYFNHIIVCAAVAISVIFYLSLVSIPKSISWTGIFMEMMIQGIIAAGIGMAMIIPLKWKYIKTGFNERGL